MSEMLSFPLVWLGLTIGVYAFGLWCAKVAKGAPWANPVLISIVVVIGILSLLEVDYATYFEGAAAIHLALGPATVALAVPLWRNRALVRENRRAVIGALCVGASVGVLSSWGIATLLGASEEMALALVPKSVTAGIAVGVAEAIGAEAALAGVLVITSGAIGAVISVPLLRLLRVTDEAAWGFAVGLSSHGIGTARALQMGALTGAFAGLGMALCGLLTALLVPLAALFL